MSLELQSVSAGYKPLQVIFDVSLSCKKGSATVMLGPNGAGKSTLVGVIMGLVPVWKGQLNYEGKDISHLPAYSRACEGISALLERMHLFPSMTTEENIKLGSYNPSARKDSENTLRMVYELFPALRNRAKVKAGRLSGGEQHMVAIGRALMSRPSMLIMDEPSLGLAPKIIDEILAVMKNLRDEGMSLLIVDQNVDKALGIADYVYLMESGRIVISGIPEEVKNVEVLRRTYFSI